MKKMKKLERSGGWRRSGRVAINGVRWRSKFLGEKKELPFPIGSVVFSVFMWRMWNKFGGSC
ncbi:hypothetical protein M569_02944 [Genlisea aurea]|uniref:Uncharacterized protein n=1 Tax=Genlisea aurea TaxID=192259 RepID=S8D336_9LAMI|nr:hypothetical protein M569_02944 [Genlisea aurea]